ncbi:MAG: hypothetical protein ABSG83_09805, partial [Roseiarcus sp.]
MDGRRQIGVLRRADFLDGIPILAPALGFARLEKAEVRLVVGINAGHDFDVRGEFTAGVGNRQIPVPGVAKFMVSPGPLFLPRRNVVVCVMHDASLRQMVVAPEEV